MSKDSTSVVIKQSEINDMYYATLYGKVVASAATPYDLYTNLCLVINKLKAAQLLLSGKGTPKEFYDDLVDTIAGIKDDTYNEYCRLFKWKDA